MASLLHRACVQQDTGSPNKAYMDKMQQWFSSTALGHGSLSTTSMELSPPWQKLLELHDKFQQEFTPTLSLKVIYLQKNSLPFFLQARLL